MDNIRRKMWVTRLLLGIWMSAILILQIILYPPIPVLKLADRLNLIKPLYAIQDMVLPFFQTTDLNIEFDQIFND